MDAVALVAMSSTGSQSSSTRRAAFVSVGTKLAAPTVCIVALIAIGIYLGLSRYERSNLLAAKKTAAVMVARLFTVSASAPVVFGDESAVQELVTSLGSNEEVVFGAVWGVDKGHPLKTGAKMGELIRAGFKPSDAPPVVHQDIRMDQSNDWILVESPVMDTQGKLVGVSQVAFSLARENASNRVIEKRVLLLSVGISTGLMLILLGLARLTIVRPLAKLAYAAQRLEKGESATVEATANDEIGRLARGFQAMSAAIAIREGKISARNYDMRLVLDNAEEGFLTLDRQGAMSHERSRILETWFGAPAPEATFFEYLAQIDTTVASWFQLGWDAVIEDILPLELAIDQLPSRFDREGRSYELRYRPIFEAEILAKMLVVICDITGRIERERIERDQREMMNVFGRILANRAAFEEFFMEACSLVETIEQWDGSDTTLLRRQIHTLKGNCSIFGLEGLVNFCHALESRMIETDTPPTGAEQMKLRDLWNNLIDMCAKLGQSTHSTSIEIEEAEHTALLEALRARTEHRKLATLVASWKFEPIARRFDGIADQIKALAKRLGKGDVKVECKTSASFRLPPQRWAPFWSVFTHVVRNMVDHGLESEDERQDNDKHPQGHVVLAMEDAGDEIIISISDDGRGIDWEKIALKAAQKGLPYATQKDLLEALFSDGVSTRDEANDVSGRGIGMGAVRQTVLDMGGRIDVKTQQGQGTSFRFTFSRFLLNDRSPLSTMPPSPSLGPQHSLEAFRN